MKTGDDPVVCRYGVPKCKGDHFDLVRKICGDAAARREAGLRFRRKEICRACAYYHRAIYAVRQGSCRQKKNPRRGRD